MSKFLHHNYIPDARILGTTPMLEARDRFREVLDDNRMTAFYGDAGLGKTSTIDWLLKGQKRPWKMLTTPADPSPPRITLMLLEELTGLPEKGQHHRLTQRLLEILEERKPIIAIDEAQGLRLRAIETLRLLWDQTPGHFPLLLIGGHNCWKTIRRHPMVESRLRRPMEFVALSDEEVERLIPGYHPIYHGARVEHIRTINTKIARGVLRRWNDFTLTALRTCQELEQPRLNSKVLKEALASHSRKPVSGRTTRKAA